MLRKVVFLKAFLEKNACFKNAVGTIGHQLPVNRQGCDPAASPTTSPTQGLPASLA